MLLLDLLLKYKPIYYMKTDRFSNKYHISIAD